MAGKYSPYRSLRATVWRRGVEHVALRSKVYPWGRNLIVELDCSNAFNTVQRAAFFREFAGRTHRLAPFVAKCCGGTQGDVLF